MNVPLLDLKAQYAAIRDEVDEAIHRVVERQGFVLGPEVDELERRLAEYCQVPHAVGCASGSDAILLALLAHGIGPGDEVICPSFTFYATAGSIAMLGAVPVFVDIDPVTFNMSPELVRERAGACTRLKAIIPVDLYGQCADMAAFVDLGVQLGVPIIEDAAQAIGARDAQGGEFVNEGPQQQVEVETVNQKDLDDTVSFFENKLVQFDDLKTRRPTVVDPSL